MAETGYGYGDYGNPADAARKAAAVADEAVDRAVEWLKRASAAHGAHHTKMDERAEMISACAAAADTWLRLAEFATGREVVENAAVRLRPQSAQPLFREHEA